MNQDAQISNYMHASEEKFTTTTIDPSKEIAFDEWSFTYHIMMISLVREQLYNKLEDFKIKNPKADVASQEQVISDFDWFMRWLYELRIQYTCECKLVMAARLENLALLRKVEDLAELLKLKEKEIEILKLNIA